MEISQVNNHVGKSLYLHFSVCVTFRPLSREQEIKVAQKKGKVNKRSTDMLI